MTDDLLPITPLTDMPVQTSVLKPKQRRIKNTTTVHFAGYKVVSSVHRLDIEKWLMQDISVLEIERRLRDLGENISRATLAAYKVNYLSTLDEKAKAALAETVAVDRAAEDSMVIGELTHSRISRVESLRQLITITESKIKEMTGKESKDMMAFGSYLDRLAKLRGELETVDQLSEVERERTKGIMTVAKCALKYLKGRDVDAHRFISEVAAIRNRKDMPTDG